MKLVFKLNIFLFLLLSICNELSANTRQEFSKTIKKEFEIAAKGTTSISNKHGKVDILTWDRNRVKIEVNIIVEASSESNAQSVFKRINIKFVNYPNFVSATTNIASRKKNWWESSQNDGSDDYTINYQVYLPATNNLRLDHKFGDITIAKLKGSADLKIKNSNFTLGGFGETVKLDLAHSTGVLLKAREINSLVQHSRLNIEEVEFIKLNSLHSRIGVKKAKDMRCNSTDNTFSLGEITLFHSTATYDDVEIERADDIVITATYSNILIHKVIKNLDLEMESGKAAIGEVSKDFQQINLKGDYTDFMINLAFGTAYSMDAYADFAGIRYPKSLNVSYEREKETRHEVKGYVGQINVASNFVARLNYGALRIFQK